MNIAKKNILKENNNTSSVQKIVTIVGARPQFIKAAVLRRLFDKKNIHEILVHTGQHYDENMSKIFFDEFNIKAPEYFLQLSNRSHAGMTGEILHGVEQILQKEQPDMCLVYGDTNSTLAGALAASKLHIPVCHIESGLRSFNKKMPEEVNRILTDHVSELLFCPTYEAIKNLSNEGIHKGVYHVGDIMYDAVRFFKMQMDAELLMPNIFKKDTQKKLACMTLHRQENIQSKQQLQRLIHYVQNYTKEYQIIFACHPNTKNKLKEYHIDCAGMQVIAPQPYLQMQALLANSALVLTDSGGLQKEAYFHQVQCITLRDETEWVETITHGWNRLWRNADYITKPRVINEYGEGDSAEKILDILINNKDKNSVVL